MGNTRQDHKVDTEQASISLEGLQSHGVVSTTLERETNALKNTQNHPTKHGN